MRGWSPPSPSLSVPLSLSPSLPLSLPLLGDFFGEIALTMSTKRIADAKSLGSVGGLGPLKSEMR